MLKSRSRTLESSNPAKELDSSLLAEEEFQKNLEKLTAKVSVCASSDAIHEATSFDGGKLIEWSIARVKRCSSTKSGTSHF